MVKSEGWRAREEVHRWGGGVKEDGGGLESGDVWGGKPSREFVLVI